MLLIPALRKWRQKDWKFKVILVHSKFVTSLDCMRPCHKTHFQQH